MRYFSFQMCTCIFLASITGILRRILHTKKLHTFKAIKWKSSIWNLKYLINCKDVFVHCSMHVIIIFDKLPFQLRLARNHDINREYHLPAEENSNICSKNWFIRVEWHKEYLNFSIHSSWRIVLCVQFPNIYVRR